MNINITPQEDSIKYLYHIISTEIVVPGSPDEELIKELITESITEYTNNGGNLIDISNAKIHILFQIIRKMRILEGSWNPDFDFE